jgi:WD40 repeat protein
MTRVIAPPSPFKGLAPFGDSDLDALLFFGRARETEVIAANLQASRLTVLFGPSGVGKSSVLRAGVAHRLRQEPDTAVEFVDTWAADAAGPVRDALGGKPDHGDLYLVLDQFEEYFLYHAEDTELPGLLADVVAQRGLRVNVLIGIRDDSLARLDTFRRPIPNLLANRLRLDRLDRESARAAIVGPIRRYNELTGESVEVDSVLVDAVLDEVTAGRLDLGRAGRGGLDGQEHEGRVEAPYLQLVLERLWEAEREAGSSQLRLETLQRLGGAVTIVHDHLEHAMAELTPEEKEAAAAMYHHLVTPSGMKIAHRVTDLAGYASVGEPEATQILRKLARERIVRGSSDDGPAATRYEIFHDVLADAVLAWRARHEEERALHESEARSRRAHRLAAAALAGLIVVAAIAVFALLERSNARAQARRAHADELAAKAVTELDLDPGAALRMAYDAARLHAGLHEEDVLRRALLADRLRQTLHMGASVNIVAFAPAGNTFLVGARDGKVRVYRRGSPKPIRVLRQGDAAVPVTAALFSADGRRAFTGGEDRTAHIWDVVSGKLLHTLAAGPVASAQFVRDGRDLVTTSADGKIRLWRTRDGRLLRSFKLNASVAGDLKSVVTDPSGRFAVAVSHDRFARIYSLAAPFRTCVLRSACLLRTVELAKPMRRIAHDGFVGAVTFSPDGRLLLTASYTGNIRLWRTGSWKLVRRLLGGQRNIPSAEFSPDGMRVAAASADGTVRIWEVATGLQLAVAIGHRNEVTSVAFNPDATAVVSTSTDGTARVWGAIPSNGGRVISVLTGHRGPVVAAAFSPDGHSVLTAGEDGTARLWDPGSQPDLVAQVRRPYPLTALAVEAGGRKILVGGGRRAELFTADGHHLLRTIRSTHGQVADVGFGPRGPSIASAPATALSYSRDGTRRALAAGREVRVQGAGGRRSRILRLGALVHDVSFSPDGSVLGVALQNDTAQLWDIAAGRRLRTLRGHAGAVFAIAFSPDGRLVATASADRDARLWDADTGALVQKLHGHFGPVKDVRFSPDGRTVVTAGPTTAGVWDTEHGQMPAFLRAPVERPFSAAAFAGADGRLVLATSLDGTLRTYRCSFCGDVHDLVALAKRRIAAER